MIEKNLIKATEKLFAEALETMKKKNADYSGDNTSLKNFEVSAQVANIKMSKGILVRLMDKMTRIGNLLDRDAMVKDESIYDTIQDAINYAAILLQAIRLENEEINNAMTSMFKEEYIPGQRRIGERIGDERSDS